MHYKVVRYIIPLTQLQEERIVCKTGNDTLKMYETNFFKSPYPFIVLLLIAAVIVGVQECDATEAI